MRKKEVRAVFYREYRFFAFMLGLILIFAFVVDSPQNIGLGLWKIMTSRSILITDYMLVGGIGAMLVNGVLAGLFALVLIILIGVKPNGSTIMALWMTLGFGFFGKNLFNMIPLIFGVWLYAKFQKERFINYTLAALLVATLSPVVSEIAFGNLNGNSSIVVAVLVGIITGFLFPMVSSFTVRVHDGFNLYNMGFAGGIIAMLLIATLKSGGIVFETASLWGEGKNKELAILLYALSAILIIGGFLMGRGRNQKKNMKRILRSSGRLVSDYYVLYGETSYINMGILGILGTTITLALGAEVNGPTMGGILTMVAFGCFGKHVKNVLPILVGAIAATFFNTLDPTAPVNILAVLFSTGLAPIAGQFGVIWGIVAGFIHVSIVIHAGYMTNGLNLYNNGFAAGFVAMMLVPVIVSIKNRND